MEQKTNKNIVQQEKSHDKEVIWTYDGSHEVVGRNSEEEAYYKTADERKASRKFDELVYRFFKKRKNNDVETRVNNTKNLQDILFFIALLLIAYYWYRS